MFWHQSVCHGAKRLNVRLEILLWFWHQSVCHGAKRESILTNSENLFWHHSVCYGAKRFPAFFLLIDKALVLACLAWC